MVVLAIVLALFGASVFFIGLSSYRDRKNKTMPLLLRSAFQSISEQMGIGMMIVGGGVGVVGVVMLISRLV